MGAVHKRHHRRAGGLGTLRSVDEPISLVPLNTPDAVDLRQLRAFVAVAEELNFGRAARRLYVSQPSLSRQIKSLERLIGCELLVRNTHRVELTLAGHALLTNARPVLAALDQAIATAQSVGGELNARMMAAWAPLLAVGPSVSSVENLREIFENVLAAMPVPEDLTVRPVTAGGVSALILGGEPALLYVHGGGFVLGSAYGYRPLVSGVVVAAGVGALVPDYRLAPEHPYPAALDDVIAAYRWLTKRRDASNIVLVADSSGCALTLALLHTLRAAHEQLPGGAVFMCPSLDLSGGLHGLRQPVDAVAATAREYVRDANAHLSGLPPLLVQCATDDLAYRDAETLEVRARSAGIDVIVERYRTPVHVFQLFWSFLPDAALAMDSAGNFVRSVLATPDAAFLPSPAV
jgi:monoterpene epsilon-lactone hydrolase